MVNIDPINKEREMNELKEIREVEVSSVDEALALIDKGLGELTDRQLISTAEVSDLLLDVRTLLGKN